jgi:hypothetical protein
MIAGGEDNHHKIRPRSSLALFSLISEIYVGLPVVGYPFIVNKRAAFSFQLAQHAYVMSLAFSRVEKEEIDLLGKKERGRSRAEPRPPGDNFAEAGGCGQG